MMCYSKKDSENHQEYHFYTESKSILLNLYLTGEGFLEANRKNIQGIFSPFHFTILLTLFSIEKTPSSCLIDIIYLYSTERCF